MQLSLYRCATYYSPKIYIHFGSITDSVSTLLCQKLLNMVPMHDGPCSSNKPNYWHGHYNEGACIKPVNLSACMVNVINK